MLAPVPVSDIHEVDIFVSGEAALDGWLRHGARVNHASGAARTYVAFEGRRVIGYYALASGVIAVESAPGRLKRNMPIPFPSLF